MGNEVHKVVDRFIDGVDHNDVFFDDVDAVTFSMYISLDKNQ